MLGLASESEVILLTFKALTIMKAKRLLFLVMAICLTSGVRAQIKNTGVLFFHCYENTIHGKLKPITNPSAGIIIIRVRNGVIESNNKDNPFWYDFISAGYVETVVNNLKGNSNYYDSVSFVEETSYKYDSKMSNSNWTVWSRFEKGIPFINYPDQTYYFAIKNDYSEFMNWKEPDIFRNSDGSEVESGRYKYKRYTKEQLLKLTFGGRRDFLN